MSARPSRPHSLRARILGALAIAAILALAGCAGQAGTIPDRETASGPSLRADDALPGTAIGTAGEAAAMIVARAERHFDEHALQSLLVQVRVDGAVVSTVVLGDALTGVPISEDGRFRNGAVAIMYVAATMLRMAEEGMIDIDEPIARWRPDLPFAETVTPRMLAQMTAGYPDHVADAEFLAAFDADPFAQYSAEDILAISARTPHVFEPGTNWDYSHAGYFVLGQVLEAAGDAALDELIARYVLEPLKLDSTTSSATALIPGDVIHGFTAERGIWEDATYWNPSWTLPPGAVQTTSIDDMASSFEAVIGQGTLLHPDSRADMLTPPPPGFGAPLEGCRSCHTLTPAFTYGLGVFLEDEWVFQTPLFGGYFSAVASLPEERNGGHSVTVAVAATGTERSFDDWSAALPNWSTQLVMELATELVPTNAPPEFRLPTR